MSSILIDRDREVLVVAINRPEVRNAVDVPTAEVRFRAVQEYDRDDQASVAVLTGAGGIFCAGADLKAIAAGEPAAPQRRRAGGRLEKRLESGIQALRGEGVGKKAAEGGGSWARKGC